MDRHPLTPTPADLDRALEAAIAITGVGRYRYLVREHPDPTVRAQYGRLVAEIAAGGGRVPPGPAPVRVDYGSPAPAAPCCRGSTPPV